MWKMVSGVLAALTVFAHFTDTLRSKPDLTATLEPLILWSLRILGAGLVGLCLFRLAARCRRLEGNLLLSVRSEPPEVSRFPCFAAPLVFAFYWSFVRARDATPLGDAIAAGVGGSVAGVLLAIWLPATVVFTDVGIYDPTRSLWRRWRNLTANDLVWHQPFRWSGRYLGTWLQTRWGRPQFASLLPDGAVHSVRDRLVDVLQRHLPGAAESLGLRAPAAST